MEDENKKYPEGYFVGIWMVIWIAIFTAIGIPLAHATGNPGMIGIGPAIGTAVGVAIGQGVENKYKKEGKIRPLTESELKRKKFALIAGVVFLAICALLGLILFVSLSMK